MSRDVADGAAHSRPEGAYELGVAPVFVILVKRFGIPLRLGFLAKIRVREKPDTGFHYHRNQNVR
jgi:hypothetical protein